MVDKECCKFRTKRLDHEELMHRVFTGAAATGKNAWTPGEMRNQLEAEGEFGSADFSTDSNEMGASETANLMKSANINASGSGSKRGHSSVTAVQEKRVTGAEALATSMDDLVNLVKTQSKELTVNHVVGEQSVTMAKAVARLYEIQGLDQTNPLLHFGISLMEVPNNREMVMSIPSDEGIIGWLQVKQQDKERTTTVPTLVQLHHKSARLLGYSNYADYAVNHRMANSSSKKKEEGDFPFGIEDLLYYMKRIEEQQFNLDVGVLKQYFPFNLVMSGILKICQDLFGLRSEEIADAEIPVALLTSHTALSRFSEVVNIFHEFGHVFVFPLCLVSHVCWKWD
ncbi:putative thimet oligopeptidase [Camellia lanceoleosa]|uniref:Thimet oligopeptidase n=1 Tax=Camellia lanceoleosa TaxID=1840588 RepID=A0ACC0GBJ5_9ERIC|nr:putative thimet oligopeptidase [Camellia lanceoleosa]